METLAEDPALSSWWASGAAFWAGRANLVAQRPDRVRYWMNRAAQHRLTFYGQLAARVLGLERDFDWSMPQLSTGHVKDPHKRHPAARRAIALLQVNAHDRAENELKALTSIENSDLGEALMALADTARLASLSVRTASMVDDGNGAPLQGARYPVAALAAPRRLHGRPRAHLCVHAPGIALQHGAPRAMRERVA